MSHLEQIGFFDVVAAVNSDVIRGARVLEIGSYDVNGGIRQLFGTSEQYVGVDLDAGPGVDVVGFGHEIQEPDGAYDVTLSGECLEHDQYWRETFLNMTRMTRPGGLVAFSCASRGRVEHGTIRSSKEASPGTTAIGLDYYGNLGERDFAALPLDELFSEYRFWYLETHFDLFFTGVRAGETAGKAQARIPGDAAVHALRKLMSVPYRAVMLPFRALSKVLPDDKYRTLSLPLWNGLFPVIVQLEERRVKATASD